MADINTEIDKISTAVYGEEIRGSIVNALSYIDKSLNNKQEKRGLDTEPTLNSPNYLTSGTVYTALQKKADKATTLSGYGITDAYTKTEADNSLANKADKATTLEGYGITDTYTKSYIDKSLNNKQEKRGLDTEPTLNSPNYLTSGTVYTALQKKADKATTLAGYGITDAYTKGETQKNYGLNFSVGFNSSYIPITIDTTTDIQNGTFTSSDIVTAFISSDVEYIRSGAFTGCTNLKSVNIMNKAEGITIEQDAFGYDVQVNYINSYNYLKYAGIALRNLNTQKADNTNVYSRTVLDGKFAALPTYEEGSGTLTPTAENKLKNASFTYQRLGNCVTVQVACTFLAYEQTADGTVRLDGLPFVCGNNLPTVKYHIAKKRSYLGDFIQYISTGADFQTSRIIYGR